MMNEIFQAERIERWPLAKLRPYVRNSKDHSDDQVAKIAASITKFGWTVPCLVAADGELIAGHGRVLAAVKLGLTEAPVIVLGHLTEDERKAYRIADNKLTELGVWNEEALSTELRDLMGADFDLSLLGFADADISRMLAFEGDGGGLTDPDDVPEPDPDAPVVSRPGDVWLLGAYFECESCHKRYTVEQAEAMGGECSCDVA